jgi:hypothetical protein
MIDMEEKLERVGRGEGEGDRTVGGVKTGEVCHGGTGVGDSVLDAVLVGDGDGIGWSRV